MLRLLKKTNRDITARLPVFFSSFRNLRTKYQAFSQRTDEEFASFVTSLENHPVKRHLLDELAQDRQIPATFSLLDMGCGPGVFAHMIAKHPTLVKRVHYIGVDQSAGAIEYCKKTYPKHFQFVQRDILTDGLPEGEFQVVAINEVVEHLSHYQSFMDHALAKKPDVFLMGTFAVLPGLKNHRRLWRNDTQCFMNSYAFDKFFMDLRQKTPCPIRISDFGSKTSQRFWFPNKTLLGWYVNLNQPLPEQP